MMTLCKERRNQLNLEENMRAHTWKVMNLNGD